MPSSAATRRFGALVLSLGLALGLAACSTGLEGFTQDKVEGYDLSQDALAQIRPGQSQALVTTVLGSPQLTNDFGQESAYYYVSTHVTQTALGTTSVNSRTVLAIYFDKNKKVKDRAVYSLKDGRPVTIETRRTPSYGEDRTFIQSILNSFGSSAPSN
jgi:outer membrane protein assembly factor BamE (lipoprotein component of BamABCDE complex)